MKKYVGLQIGNKILMNSYGEGFLKKIYESYTDYRIRNLDTNEVIEISGQELSDHFTKKEIEGGKFYLCSESREEGFQKIRSINELNDIHFGEEMELSMNENYGNEILDEVKRKSVFSRDYTLKNMLSDDFRHSRAKKNVEINNEIEKLFPDEEEKGNEIVVLFKNESEDGITSIVYLDSYNNVSVKYAIKEDNEKFGVLKEHEKESSYRAKLIQESKDIHIKGLEIFKKNIQKIEAVLCDEFLKRKKTINTIHQKIYSNDILKGNKTICERIDKIKNAADSTDGKSFLTLESGNTFQKDEMFSQDDCYLSVKYKQVTETRYETKTFQEITNILEAKQVETLGRFEEYLAKLEIEKVVNGDISGVGDIKINKNKTNVKESLIEKIEQQSDGIIKDIQSIKSKIGSKKKSDVSLNFEVLSMKKNTDESIFEDQKDRADRYAEAFLTLSEISKLYENLHNFDFVGGDIKDFKEIAENYSRKAQSLESNYSGEGGLKMNSKILKNIIHYINLEENIGEYEIAFLKDFVYTSSAEMVSHIYKNINGKDNKEEKEKIDGYIDVFKNLNPADYKIEKICSIVSTMLDTINNGDEVYSDALKEYKISNIEGRGAYYTPNNVTQLLKPFTSNLEYINQVNLLDVSAGKGSLLNSINGENIRKIGNDVNPISLKVLKYTSDFEHKKLADINTLDSAYEILNNKKTIITEGSAISYLHYDLQADFFLSNPPYINAPIGGKEEEKMLVDNKVKTLSGGKVNMVEFTYKGLIDKLKLGGVGMLISSARGISKIEQKVRLDTDTYLVPLYRIGVGGDPFETQGVKLAGIQISGEDVYNFRENELVREDGTAEFFVTFYSKLDKKQQEKFSNIAPTIILENYDISNFSDFVEKNIENHEVLENYKNYFSSHRIIELTKAQEFLGDKVVDEEFLSKEKFQEEMKSLEKINEYLSSEVRNNKKIAKIKYLKPKTALGQKITESIEKMRFIETGYLPLFKESFKGIIKEKDLLDVFKNDFKIEHNGYSFSIKEDSGIKKIGKKYMFEDKDLTPLIIFPYPFSLNILKNNTFADITERYLHSISTNQELIENRLKEIDDLLEEYISFNGEKGVKVIKELSPINFDSITNFIEQIEKNKLDIQSNDIEVIENVSDKIHVEGVSKTVIEEYIYYFSDKKIPKEGKDLHKLLMKGRKFPKGYKLRARNNLLAKQSKESVILLKKMITQYSQKKGNIKSFDLLVMKNYSNSIGLLEELGKNIIIEFHKGNNYFDLADKFSESKSEVFREFSQIGGYRDFKSLIKVDRFISEIDLVDSVIVRTNNSILREIHKLSVKRDFKEIVSEVEKYTKKKFGKDYGVAEKKINSSLIKFQQEFYDLDLDLIESIESKCVQIEEAISEVETSELKEICTQNYKDLSKNLETLQILLGGINECHVINEYTQVSKVWRNTDNIKKLKEYLTKNQGVDIELFDINSIASDIRSSINKEYTSIESSIGKDRYLGEVIQKDVNLKRNVSSEFKDISNEYFENKIFLESKEVKKDDNMLIDVYNPELAMEMIKEFKNKTQYIESVVDYYKIIEIDLKNSKESKGEISEEKRFLLLAKYITQNTNEFEKMFLLEFLKEQRMSGIDFKDFVESNIEKTGKINTEAVKNIYEEKSKEFSKGGIELAESIISSLGVKSNFVKLYTNIFLDIESKFIREKSKEELFKNDFLKFQEFLNTISPYEVVINKSRRYATVLDQKSLLRKRSPLLKDLLEIDEYSDFYNESSIESLSEEEQVEILMKNAELKKYTNQRITKELNDIQNELSNLDELIGESNKRLSPTFVQAKSLYKFKKSVDFEKDCVKLLNQSEVGTGKTFTMPFYEAVLDEKFKNVNQSIKIYITEANLVSNTTKSLIENGRNPENILEAKLSGIDDIQDIIKFINSGGNDIILSSSSLHNFQAEAVRSLGMFLKKNNGNIYLYSDEATFLKNTESTSYSGFKFILGELKKTKNLKLQNYLTATPVNNDNGDFLYLADLFNKKNILSYVRNSQLSPVGSKKLYDIVGSLSNLQLGEKLVESNDKGDKTYYYVPKVTYLLEYLRTGTEYSLFNFHLSKPVEVPNKFDATKTEYISAKEYYNELGVPISIISEEEYKNKKFILSEPIHIQSKDNELAYRFTEVMKNVNSINFDRNLNSIGLEGSQSQLYKTYYSLKPSLVESMVIENFIDVVEKIGKYKKITQAIQDVKKNGIYQLESYFFNEGKNILTNLLLEVCHEGGLSMQKDSYSAKVKEKQGFKEVEVEKRFEILVTNKTELKEYISKNNDESKIFGNKVIDSLLMNIDAISYTKYNEMGRSIELLKQQGVNQKTILKEEKKQNKYLENITSIVGSLIGEKINSKITGEEFTEKFMGKIQNNSDEVRTVKNTYIDTPIVTVDFVKNQIKDSGIRNIKIENIHYNLDKGSQGGFAERSYIIQLLEDYNTPLASMFIEKSIKGITTQAKEYDLDVTFTDKQVSELKDYIITKGNTLSGTLSRIATENSKSGVNSFITTSYVNTVLNVHREIDNNTGKAYMITGKHTKNSKEKLNIINKFDKLDGYGKTLIATGKSVEKGLSIFNSLKGYTTVGDENAGAITQRIGRFRTLMGPQMNDLDTFIEKQSNTPEGKKNIQNSKLLKENKKEFFVLSNKLSESMLTNSEQKNILLQKVNATTLFDGIEDFNDNYYGGESTSFNVQSVLSSVREMIKENKKEFYDKLKNISGVLTSEILSKEVQRNIERNIKENIKSMQQIEGIRIGNKELKRKSLSL